MNTYKKPLIISVSLHIVVFVFLFVSLPATKFHMPSPQANAKPVVKAVTVNQQAVESEIAKIKRQRRLAHERSVDETRRLQRQRQQAQRQLTRARQQRKLVQRRIAKAKAAAARQLKQAKLKRQQIERQAKALAAKAKQQRARQAALAAKHRAEKQRLAKLQQQQKLAAAKALQQQLAQEQKVLAAAKSRQVASEVDKYKALIVQAISQNWLVPNNTSKNVSCQLLVKVGPGGAVLSVQILHSSGNPVLDRSARTAVFKTSPLPVPKDPSLFDKFRTLRLTVKPEQTIL